jgi:hypothetical protein
MSVQYKAFCPGCQTAPSPQISPAGTIQRISSPIFISANCIVCVSSFEVSRGWLERSVLAESLVARGSAMLTICREGNCLALAHILN